MSNTSLRKLTVLAVSAGLLIAVLSGSAVTYASFTDSGSVDVTFSAGNITSGSDDVSGTASTGNNSETTLNDSDTTDNETNLNDSDTTDNETNLNDSERLTGELPGIDVPATNGLNVGRTSDAVSAAAATFFGHRGSP